MLLSALSGAPLPRRDSAVAPGATVLGKYRVLRELGVGGGGRAFLAEDVRMKRNVVVKTISGSDHQAALREARTAAAIEHPNVVRVYDIEDLGAEALLVMEYVDGGSLKDRIATSGAMADDALARLADDLLGALEAVHAAGAVHRDVKPGNVLLTRDGRAKLSDFGIARLPGFETTMGGSASGSVQYMSPEQARGKRVTALSDLYSAAATLYEARTGRALVELRTGESATEMQMRVGAASAFSAEVAPAALSAWFAKALEPAPAERYQSAPQMREALAAALR
jgi:eukaryotic-like serine/threonine-protein kinase